MNNSHDNQLDRLLEGWADKSVASAEDLSTLRQQVSERLASDELPPVEATHSLRSSANQRRRLMAGALAIAAMLLVAVGLWHSSQQQGIQQNELANLVQESSKHPNALLFTAFSIDHQIELLREYRAVFGSELVWLVEAKGRVDVGLQGEDSATSPPSAEYVAVQLTLWARPVKNGNVERNWTQVESFNVLAGREQLVEVAPRGSDGPPLLLWAYPLDNEMVSIDLQYQTGLFADVSIDTSNLQPIGQKHRTNIHSFMKDGVEYRLYQTADLLDRDDLG